MPHCLLYPARLPQDNPQIIVRLGVIGLDPQRLLQMLYGVFPSLAGTAASHAWVGFIAYTFDTLLHLGARDGLYHCMGYCGQGVPTATYFGMRIGQQIAGLPEGATALDGLAFPTRPLYGGNPWFLAPSIIAYRAMDALGR